MKTWIFGMFAASFLTALATALAPKGPARRAASFAGGLLIILAALSPVAKVTAQDIASAISKYRFKAEAIRTGIDIGSTDIMEAIIQEQTEAYILDKAQELGLELEVTVSTTRAEDGWPYPSSVELSGSFTESGREKLSKIMETELALGPDSQEWS